MLVVEYIASELSTLKDHKDFVDLLEEGGEFVVDFWRIAVREAGVITQIITIIVLTPDRSTVQLFSFVYSYNHTKAKPQRPAELSHVLPLSHPCTSTRRSITARTV
jgi:hypothetical protein